VSSTTIPTGKDAHGQVHRIDAHATSCTLRSLTQRAQALPASGRDQRFALVEAVRSIPRPRHLCLEEGHTARGCTRSSVRMWTNWQSSLSPRARVQERSTDAFARAEQLRIGHSTSSCSRRRRNSPCYVSWLHLRCSGPRCRTHAVSPQSTLSVSRITTTGKTVYGTAQRDEWLERLPVSHRPSAELLYCQLDAAQALKKSASKQLIAESHRHPISEVLETCPGLAEVRVALLIPVVVTPHRFRTARSSVVLGPGVVMRSSSDWTRDGDRWVRAQVNKTRGLSRSFNHTLKYFSRVRPPPSSPSTRDTRYISTTSGCSARAPSPTCQAHLARKIAATRW